ncbi:hypothetical protein BOX15_Mlig017461g1 [Macrostomum lignano]|uniref:Secreted protein n=1 Tax=Macrostomum lignano TaxID=282301 RepID=A0A267DP26_9PLAT|nr:hypothetical protein BOX15_Mlig017461g2 [Macrostomum lignano]PAA88209.1 hypothetical protein BOX15_Mlig017461g1 [Macrostomum lignano]
MSKRCYLLALALCALLGLVSASGDAECASERRTKTANLGGKVISQSLVRMRVGTGQCLWVREGSTPNRYRSESCMNCRVYGSNQVYCTGAPSVAVPPPCVVALGPDCSWHTVDPTDKTKACDPAALMKKRLAAGPPPLP